MTIYTVTKQSPQKDDRKGIRSWSPIRDQVSRKYFDFGLTYPTSVNAKYIFAQCGLKIIFS